MDALVIYSLSGDREVIDSLKTFRLAEKADWVAFQKGRKDSTLYVQPLNANLSTRYEAPAVKAFNFAEKSGMLYYITAGDKAEEKPGLYLLNTETGVKTLIKEGDGVFKQVTFDEDGANLAFLYCAQKDSCYKAMSLWLSQQGSTGNRSCGTWQSGFSERMGNQRAWEITIFEECFPVVFWHIA